MFLNQTINCRGQLLDFSAPKVMGIINLNADSFFEGSRVAKVEDFHLRLNKMVDDGADIIDIGVMSSRPGAKMITHEEEWAIIEPFLSELSQIEVPISLDTVRSLTAKKGIEKGVSIINDISGGSIDDKMMELVASYQNIPYIMMHMRGTPETMQSLTQYDDIMMDLIAYFSAKITKANQFGIQDVILDPGFGFAKTLDQNYEVLAKLDSLKIFDKVILAGLSRKSMLYKLLDIDAENALNATTAANMIALMNGAKILRVHDVLEAKQAVTVFLKVNFENY
jgi:dihydropteroate synthase